MNAVAHNAVAELAERVDAFEKNVKEEVGALRERVDSTRRRFDESESAQRKMAECLQAIQFDVHEIRAGKKAALWLVKVILGVVVATGGGVVVAARWTIDHWLQDMQLQHDPSHHRSIDQ